MRVNASTTRRLGLLLKDLERTILRRLAMRSRASARRRGSKKADRLCEASVEGSRPVIVCACFGLNCLMELMMEMGNGAIEGRSSPNFFCSLY